MVRREERDFNDGPDDDGPDDDEPDVDEDELDDVEHDDERHGNELQPESVSFFRAYCLAQRGVTTVHPSLSSCG